MRRQSDSSRRASQPRIAAFDVDLAIDDDGNAHAVWSAGSNIAANVYR
jgi:hypothetical protein